MTPSSLAPLIPCSTNTVKSWLRTGKVRPRWRLRVLEIVGADPSPMAELLRRACSDPAPAPPKTARPLRACDIAAACGVTSAMVSRWLDAREVPAKYRRRARVVCESGGPMTRAAADFAALLRAWEIADTIELLREHAGRIPAHAGAVARAVEALEGIV
jgi:hypothetical protein